MQPRSFLSAAGVRCAALVMSAAAALPAAAQGEFPNRTIRLITPAAPGGTTDILSRLVAAKLTETMGQQVIVDNRASASGVNAGEITARAAPDGYTLLLVYHQHTINAALNAKLPYHPVNDFTPISQLTSAGLFLVVNPNTPAKTPKLKSKYQPKSRSMMTAPRPGAVCDEVVGAATLYRADDDDINEDAEVDDEGDAEVEAASS